MKLSVRGFSIAVGIVIAAAFSICAFFVAVAPEATAAFLYLLHINVAGLTRPLSWPSYFAGVLAVGVWTGLWAAVVAGLYNFLISR
jgi:predicted anti-sigma-YlaC factor YlaD